jgi:hypothetical protein
MRNPLRIGPGATRKILLLGGLGVPAKTVARCQTAAGLERLRDCGGICQVHGANTPG